MRGTVSKRLKKLLINADARILLLIHNEYGDKTKDMSHRQVYNAVKSMYKKGLIKFKNGTLASSKLPMKKENVNVN